MNSFQQNQANFMSLDKTLNKLSFLVYKMRRLNFAISLMSLQILILYDSEASRIFFGTVSMPV